MECILQPRSQGLSSSRPQERERGSWGREEERPWERGCVYLPKNVEGGEGKKQRANSARQSQAKAHGNAPADLPGASTYKGRNRCIGLVLTLPKFHLASLIRRPDYQSVTLPHPPPPQTVSISQSVPPPTPPKQYHHLPDHSRSVPSKFSFVVTVSLTDNCVT